MGCFNTTCFISQQTIAPEDRVYLFPIEQGSSYRPVDMSFGDNKLSQYSFTCSTCYPTGLWTVSGPMLEGTYDDYGRFSIPDTPSNLRNMFSLFCHLLENSAVVTQGDNQFHDTPFDMSSKFNPTQKYSYDQLIEVWEYMWSAVEENRIFVKNFSEAAVPFAFAVMHKVAGDYLIETINKNSEEDVYTYLDQQFKRKLKTYPHKESMVISLGCDISSLEGFRFGRFEGCYPSLFYGNNTVPVIKIITQFCTDNPDTTSLDIDTTKAIMDIMSDAINFRYILDSMHFMNAKFSPMVYASQDYSNELGNEFANMVVEVNKRVNTIVKEKYGEDED